MTTRSAADPDGRLDGLRWSVTLRGLVALAVGLLGLIWPATALPSLAALYGAYVLVDGLVLLTAAARTAGDRRLLLGLQGLAGLLAGVAIFVAPQGPVVTAVFLFGVWAVVTGLLEAALALRLTPAAPVAGLLGVGGVLSVVLGIILLRSPSAGALLFARVFGAYQVAGGVVRLTFASRLRRAGRRARVAGLEHAAAA